MNDIQKHSENQEILIEKAGIVKRITVLFMEPSKLFPCLIGKVDWLMPFIIVVILGGLINYATRPIIARDMRPITEKSMEKYKDQLGEVKYNEMMTKINEGFDEAERNPFKWYYIFTWSLFPFIVMAAIALLGLITGNFFFGGKSSFWIVMNVVAYAALIGLLGDIIRSIMIMAKDTMYVYTGLGLLKAINDESFVYYLLRQIDLFSIWRIAVTAIGLGCIYKMKPKRFYFVLVSIWLVFVIFVAFANLFSGGTIVY
jgi:hypothetical protein